jgi:hypothetical protein
MPKPIVLLPYLRASSKRVTDEVPWVIKNGTIARNGQITLSAWDCNTPLIFNRKIKVDWEGLSNDCALAEKDCVQLVVVWACLGGTGLRGRCFEGHPLIIGEIKGTANTGGNLENLSASSFVDIEAEFGGQELAGILVMRTQILLYSPGLGTNGFSPRMAGSILWEDRLEVVLDSSGERFPVEMVDFGANIAFPRNAAWRLDWYRADLNQPLLGGMCLRMNSCNSTIKKAVSGSIYDPQDNIIRNVIKYDVARTILHGILEDEDFLESANGNLFDEGSIGKTFQRLIKSLFPNDSLESLAELTKTRNEEFDARLQDALGLLSNNINTDKERT